jgi:ABC-2 type transport system ATP-binding protein
MAMEGRAIEVRGLRKSFGRVDALDGFSITVERGKVVALLGPNGAGKTTCMRILVGLLRPDDGDARVLGQNPWTAPPEHRRKIGYLSEEGFAWPKLTFRRAVAFTSSFFPSWDGPFVEELARLLQIPLDTPLLKLSRGQARKAVLALTLGPRPEVLLLDDPASALDPGARRDMISGVVGLLRESEASVLLSSHILSDVERLADEVCVMVSGKAILQLPLEELKSGARRVVLRAGEESLAKISLLPGVVRAAREEQVVTITVLGFDQDWMGNLRAKLGNSVNGIQDSPLGLEDLYLDIVGAGEKGWVA